MTLPRGQQERGEYERSLVCDYEARRRRLMNGNPTPKLTLVPKEPEPATEPEPAPPTVHMTNRLGITSVREGNRLGVTSIEEIVPHGRRLNKRFAIETLRAFCEDAGVSMVDALGSKRYQHLVRVRWACWSALYSHGHSHNEIARVFGYDHTTIMWGIKKHRAREAQGV